jgi:micrococcal nuclease
VPEDAFPAEVVRVIDGDTLLASRDGRRVRVRLIGIDAPESVRPDAPVECFGPESTAQLRRLLPPGAAVRASFQGAQQRDRFGRELWDVWLRTDRLLQAELVARGYALARSYIPHTRYAEVLAAEERSARAASLGLHGACRT